MNQSIAEIKSCLLEADWNDEVDLSFERLDFVVSSRYASVAGVWIEDVLDIETVWIGAQAEVLALRAQLDKDRDVYLLLCLAEIADESLLANIVNDTHVCRKLVVELRNRSPEEALKDIPIIFWRHSIDEDGGSASPDALCPDHVQLSQTLLRDLEGRSAAKILEKMLNSEYPASHED